MCIIRENTSKRRQQQLKKHKVQVIGLTRSRRSRCGEGISTGEKIKENMELKNLKLYLENQSIYEANEKLRERACLLHLENLALMRELQKKLLHFDHSKH